MSIADDARALLDRAAVCDFSLRAYENIRLDRYFGSNLRAILDDRRMVNFSHHLSIIIA